MHQMFMNALKDHFFRSVLCIFVAVFLGYNQYWPGGFMVFVYFYVGSTGSGSGFKSSQKTGLRLKECIM